VLDVVAILRAGTRATLGFNGDWGSERGVIVPGETVHWSGCALYAPAGMWGTASRSASAEKSSAIPRG